MDPVLLSIEDTRKALGNIGRTKVWQMCKSGALRTRKIGSRTLVTAESIRELVGEMA